jgi:hypothetical protein
MGLRRRFDTTSIVGINCKDILLFLFPADILFPSHEAVVKFSVALFESPSYLCDMGRRGAKRFYGIIQPFFGIDAFSTGIKIHGSIPEFRPRMGGNMGFGYHHHPAYSVWEKLTE